VDGIQQPIVVGIRNGNVIIDGWLISSRRYVSGTHPSRAFVYKDQIGTRGGVAILWFMSFTGSAGGFLLAMD